MRSLSDTLERIARLSNRPENVSPVTNDLVPVEASGSNPGQLSGFLAIPSVAPKKPALVVVLHGCRQNAGGYDEGSGWSRLAEEQGFLVLYPQQSRSNNPNLCFNWFSPQDTARDAGEALSIRQLIATVVDAHGVDPKRIFITGLSAGGAMANAMLATYPELFAGGAIVAGLPFGVASSVSQAFDCMRGQRLPSEPDLQARLRDASDHDGPWPKLSVWHGDSDTTVHEANAAASLAQWRGVHELSREPNRMEQIGRHQRHVWTDRHGADVMEFFQLSGMGHGTPLDPSLGYEQPGAFMLDAGLSATLGTAHFWGLVTKKTGRQAAPANKAKSKAAPAKPQPPAANNSIQTVIEQALRSAGLMR